MNTPPEHSPLKIVRIITRLNIGGPVRYLVPLDRGLLAHGNETLLVHGSVGEGEASLESLATDSRVPTRKISALAPAISPVADLKALCALVRVVFREHPDVIHTHTAKAGALGRTAALLYNLSRRRSRRCAVLHTYEGHVMTGYFSPLGSLAVRAVERTLGAVTDRVVTVSSGQRSEIVERFKITAPEKTTVVSYGLDLNRLLAQPAGAPNLRSALGIPEGDVVVGYVGRLVPIKNLPMLVRAFARAVTRCPAMWLVLAGDGPVRSEIEPLVREAGVAGRVRLLGWTHDLPALYATIDICALTSLNEGSPVALIEAMAAGIPVVATAVGGVPDVIEDGVTGVLVPGGHVERFADALVRLASDPGERGRLGAAARPSVAERFSQEQLVNTVEGLYRDTLIEKRKLGPVRARGLTTSHDQAR